MIRLIVPIVALVLFWTHGKDYGPTMSHAAEPQTRAGASTPNDNYPGGEESHYAKARDDFLEASVFAYFAAGCRVFLQPANLQQVSARLILAREYAGLQRNPQWTRDREIDQSSRKADRVGLELAAKPGVCNYWNLHPEAVAALRLADQIVSP